jgi:hypothetical protein
VCKNKKCPHCGKKLLSNNMSRHIKHMHPEKYVRKCLQCPFPENKHVWDFIKDLVKRNDSDDRKKKHRWTDEDRQELEARTNNIRHELAIQVYERWRHMGEYDDAGGYIKGGLHPRRFSLYKLSLDRINNDRPHFVGNSLNNLKFIIAGMNTRCNLVSLCGKKTCAFLRERSKQSITDAEIQAILEREKKKKAKYDGKWKPNIVYASCKNAYTKDGHKYFDSLHEMFIYVYNLLVEQRAICNITGFLMDQHKGSEKMSKKSTNPFQPSLNAKIPSKGHRPGNLEWVCACANPTDQDKQNVDFRDVPTGWTRQSFKSYISI